MAGSKSNAKKAAVRFGDYLPLNTIEIMTLVNFHHLDEKTLLDGGKVLKQKSGYTHDFGAELVAILEEANLQAPAGIESAYGPHYRHVLDFNDTLDGEAFPAEAASGGPDPGFVASFDLLARHAFKYYSPMKGYDAPLLALRDAVEGRYDAARLRELVAGMLPVLERELTVVVPPQPPAGIRGFLAKVGLAERPAARRARYELYDKLAAALDRLPGDFPKWLDFDDRVRAFAVRHADLLSVLIRAFQGLGVLVENIDSPNHDFLRFRERYVGPVDMTVALPEGFH